MGYFIIPTIFIIFGFITLVNVWRFSKHLSKTDADGRQPLKKAFLFMRLAGLFTGIVLIYYGVQGFVKALLGH
jgi:hypothetical protein